MVTCIFPVENSSWLILCFGRTCSERVIDVEENGSVLGVGFATQMG
jgi:hypothetical protein